MEFDGRDGVFTVTIRRLRKADAGKYHCGAERSFNVSYQEVSLKVLDGMFSVRSMTFSAPESVKQLNFNKTALCMITISIRSKL